MIKPLSGFMLTVFLLVASCSSTTFVDQDFFNRPDRKQVIGLVSYQSQYVETAPGSILSEEAGGAALIEGDNEYKAALDEKCLAVIKDVLRSGSMPFAFNAGPFRNVPRLESFDVLGLQNVNMDENVIKRLKEEAKTRNVDLIRNFIRENGLDGAIRIQNSFAYERRAFKMAVRTYWTIYNKAGDVVLFLVSESIDEEGRSLAYMMDTRLENEIISLTKENAGKLLVAIRES